MWPTFNPGEMNDQITVLQQTYVDDESGKTTAYLPLFDKPRYGSIETTSVNSTDSNGQLVGQLAVKIALHYEPGITSSMRLRTIYGDYEISDINNLKSRGTRFLVCSCKLLKRP